jgi:hypothetical protein
MRIFVQAVGVCGPGLPDWQAAQPILAGREPYAAAAAMPPLRSLLPPNERRRAAQIVKFALAVGAEAFAGCAQDPVQTSTVFTSSGGDGDTIHAIIRTLASDARELSPTRFHNSVHNAAAGYWSILSGAKAASSSICCHDDSFAAGLLEAAAQLAAGEPAVALIAYDVPYPSPLAEVRPIGAAFAVAFILTQHAGNSAYPSIDVALLPEPRAATRMPCEALEMLRETTPAARCLPILAALVAPEPAEVTLPYLGDMALALRLTR